MPTTILMPLPKQQFLSALGTPLVGGKIFTFAAGGSVPKATYTNAAGTENQPNPIPLNLRGEPDSAIYWSGAYRVEVRDALNQLIYSVDNFNTDPAGLWDLIKSAGSSLIGFIQASAGAIKRTIQDKLRDEFNAKDYGAIGDGLTGNSAKIGAMLTNLAGDFGNFELVFSGGDFLLDTSISVPTGAALRFKAGAKLIIPDGVTLTLNNPELVVGRQQCFKCIGTGKVIGFVRNDLIFPEWWGAIADGLNPPVGSDYSARAVAAARNAPALQAALNFAGYQYAINGLTGAVSLSYGFYVYDTTLKIPLSVNLVGYGIGSALFYYAPTGNAVESVSTNNSLLADIFIAPIAGPTWNESTGFGLYMNGVSTPSVRNVWSSGFIGGTFYFQSVIEGRMTGLISDNSHGPSFTIRGVGQGTVFENCVTAGTSGGACFDIQSGYDWHLIGCTAKDGDTGTNGFYLNACENVNLTACGAHDINREGILLTASTLNCTLTGCFVNSASLLSAGTYSAISVSGTRNKLIAPKVTANTPQYNYGIFIGGAATDCTLVNENITPGTLGQVFDGQPTGANTFHVRKVSTTDATPMNIWSKSLNNNAGAAIEATVVMRQRGLGESAVFKLWARAVTGTGGTTIATGVVYSSKSNAASTVNAALVLTNAAANAGVVSLQITGLGGAVATIDWEATFSSVSVTG